MDELVGQHPRRGEFEAAEAASEAGRGQAAEKDWCIELEGERYAGLHLLVEFWDAKHLDDVEFIEATLIAGARAANATLLETKFHKFSPNGGVTGVALLAESHISIHTWPEHAYAAIDIFMCGACNPHDAVPVLERGFEPGRSEIMEHRRGKIEP